MNAISSLLTAPHKETRRQSLLKVKEKGTPYLTSEVPLLCKEYSPRKPTVRSFYPPLSISAPF